MISHHLPNALILDGSVTVQELCTRLLDTSTNIICTSDMINLVCPVQLFLWTLAGWAFHSRAEHRCRNLQPIQADDVPESQSMTYHFVGPAIVSWGFAQVVDFLDDCVHSPVKHIHTTLSLPIRVSIGAS